MEDVKAQDIQVFDTSPITSLFDRVVIASGTSNRQTRALAKSVHDKVREAGAPVLSMEGGDTGEWVLVDLGDVVVHIMQPAIRDYYRLEDLWGEVPVSLDDVTKPFRKKVVAKKPLARKPAAKTQTVVKPASKKAPANKLATGTPATKMPSAKKAAAKSSAASKPASKKAPTKKPAAAKPSGSKPVAKKKAAPR